MAYLYKRSITINHTLVPNTDQTNFPVFISGTYSYLATRANAGKVEHASGYDIIFVDAAGTKLDHEIERYVATTGEIAMWVRVPTVSTASDTVIYVLYGSASITASQENITGVWDSNFKGVYHFGDGTSLSVADSTATNNGTTHGTPAAAAGQNGFGGGVSLNGSTDYITTNPITAGSALTWSAWIKAFASPSSANSSNIMQFGASSDSFGLGWDQTAGAAVQQDIYLQKASGAGYVVDKIATALTGGVWYYIAGVWTGSNVIAYLNGGLSISNAAASVNPISGNQVFGGAGAGINLWHGTLDEVHIATSARSADWLKTEFNNQSSPSSFYTIGAEGPGRLFRYSPLGGLGGAGETRFNPSLAGY